MNLVRITSKGQMTIPKGIRKALGIVQGGYVVIILDGNKAILSPVRSGRLVDLKGKLPVSRSYPGTDEIRQEVGEHIGDDVE